MIRNPYKKVALSSTKRTILLILAVVAIAVGGLFLGEKRGFDVKQNLSGRDYSGETSQSGISLQKDLFPINLTYAICSIIIGILLIVVLRDILGIALGILLILFAFLVMPIGQSGTSALDMKKFTMVEMVFDTIKA